MRPIFVASILASLTSVTACATAPRPTVAAAPPAATVLAPSVEVATSPMIAIASDPADAEAPPESTVAPYALVFHEGQTWRFTVQHEGAIAMASSATQTAECRVVQVELGCDRTTSHVECDSAPVNQIIGGTYTQTGRGMWRTAWNGATESLDADARMFARYPESLVDGGGTPLAHPFRGGWCVSQPGVTGTETLCVNEAEGIVGGAVATAHGTLRIGHVPRTSPSEHLASR